MCVIVHQPEGAHIDKATAKKLWEVNSHGGGFAYITDAGSVKVEKSMEFESYWRAFETARSQNPQRDFILHMRIATHGAINLDNVHPFEVDEHTVMVHNGIIHGVKDDPQMSDTRVFIRDVLSHLPPDWLDREEFVSMVEDWIGWSKLTFLTTSPHLKNTVYILNKQKGVLHKGMWLSNDNGIKPPVKAWSTPSYVKKGVSTPHTGTTWSRPKDKPVTTLASKPPADDGDFLDWLNREEKPEPYRAVLMGPLARRKPVERKRAERNLYGEITFEYDLDKYKCMTCNVLLNEAAPECDCWNLVCFSSMAPASICPTCLKGCTLTGELSKLDDEDKAMAIDAINDWIDAGSPDMSSHSYDFNSVVRTVPSEDRVDAWDW